MSFVCCAALLTVGSSEANQIVVRTGSEAEAPVVEYRDGILLYDGKLRDAAVAKLIDLYESNQSNALFETIDVDPELTTYGQNINCRCLWTFSVADLRKFNVTDVIREKEAHPDEHSLAVEEFKKELRAKS